MNGSNGAWDECAVCGRTILRGERASEYVDTEGEKADVCPLCKPRAEAAGWLPEAYAAVRAQPQARRRGATALRERLARTMATVTDAGAAPSPLSRRSRPGRPRPWRSSTRARRSARCRA